MESFAQLGITAVVLVATYFTGGYYERKHFRSIRERELRFRDMLVITVPRLPTGTVVQRAELVSGNVVVSLDYFKRFMAGLRAIIGGRIKAYEPLLDRARREAMLRMREDARRRGFDLVINTRLETSRLANSGGNGRATAGVEIFAYGTGIVSAQGATAAAPVAPVAPA